VLGGFLELVVLAETARSRSVGVAEPDLPRAGDGDELRWVGWHEAMSKPGLDLSKEAVTATELVPDVCDRDASVQFTTP
jgi:hypothetical protein